MKTSKKLVIATITSIDIKKNKAYEFVSHNSDFDIVKVINDKNCEMWYHESFFRPLNKTEKTLYENKT